MSAEIIILAPVRVRNRSIHAIDIADMVIFVVTVFDLLYELRTRHIGACDIIAKICIATFRIGVCNCNSFTHDSFSFYLFEHAFKPYSI